MDDLAVRGGVAAATQRQALNAGVLLLREVMGTEVGDISDYERARASRHLPVVLSRKEVERLLAALPDRYLLMAKLQYGAGLWLRELTHLRVKDIDFERGQILVRSGK